MVCGSSKKCVIVRSLGVNDKGRKLQIGSRTLGLAKSGEFGRAREKVKETLCFAVDTC